MVRRKSVSSRFVITVRYISLFMCTFRCIYEGSGGSKDHKRKKREGGIKCGTLKLCYIIRAIKCRE